MLLSTEPLRWRLKARCISADPEVFQNSLLERVAIEQFCNHCPVKENCLAEALKNNDIGVWGGTTERERKYMKTPRERKRCIKCFSRNIQTQDLSGICLACGFSWRSKEDPTLVFTVTV